MNIAIIFHNIGGYHAARLRAAQSILNAAGHILTVIQETDNAHEHPWGDLAQEITFPLITLISSEEAITVNQIDPQSQKAAKRLPHHLEQIKPDLLAIPGWGFPIARTALGWAQRQGIPTILMSDSKWDDEPRQWWKETIKSLLYINKFNAALVAGKPHKDYLVHLGMASEAIFLGYDVVDNDHFHPQAQHNTNIAQNQSCWRPSSHYFIAVTRFIPRKNILRLLESYGKYRQQTKTHPWDLVLCGSGVQEPLIREFIQQQQLDSVIDLPGFISYQEIPHWYAGAQCFIHASLQEQWGLVVNEAMAAGLPVLVSNHCGCFQDLIMEGVNGYGFDPENIEQLIKLMLKMSSGEVNLEAMGKASLQHIQKYSPDYFAQGFKQAIEFAINQQGTE